MTTEQTQFLKYVRAKMIFSLRLRSETDELKPVPAPAADIETRFFKTGSAKEIQTLVDAGELKVTRPNGKGFYYEALKPGAYDLSLLIVKPIPTDIVTQTMLHHLKSVSLPEGAESTDYFNLFLKYKEARADLFFKVDSFCGRVHTPVSNFHRSHRPFILLYNEETTSIDVTTMQPLLLGKILFQAIGENEYSTWINAGTDIYIKLQEKAGLDNRDAAKKKFFEILFSKPSKKLSALFGSSNWIEWINLYKQYHEPNNPHHKDKPHSNLAWLLQSTEVGIMRKVWHRLTISFIPFLSVHDEIIIPVSKAGAAEGIMNDVLGKEFAFFKLSGKNKVAAEPILSTPATFQTKKTTIKRHVEPLWDDRLADLQAYFETAALPTAPVRLNACTTILNLQSFIEKHLATVKANNGNGTYLPYLVRLKELKQALTAHRV